MKTRRRSLGVLVAWVSLVLLPGRVVACACCVEPGYYGIGFFKPSAYELGVMRRVRFGGTAHLYVGPAGLEAHAQGLANPTESYAVSGSLAGNVWRLGFRHGNSSGTLSLPLPPTVWSHKADIHDGQPGAGGGPLLYKEWRFEGQAQGTGVFRAGIGAPTGYLLVLQGRGNACDSAEDFRHWNLTISGKNADYRFHGQLAKPASPE